eukprot:6228764-Prymnesium_polylepis.1
MSPPLHFRSSLSCSPPRPRRRKNRRCGGRSCFAAALRCLYCLRRPLAPRWPRRHSSRSLLTVSGRPPASSAT